jgi:starch synthase
MKALLCHPQTQHSKKLAEVLYANNHLLKFVNPARISLEAAERLPNFLRVLLESRIIDLPPDLLESNFHLEFYRLFKQKILKNTGREFYYDFRASYQNAIKDKHIIQSDVVIGYDSSSWMLGERVKRLNKPFILERTIAHHRFTESAFTEAGKKYPEWSAYYRNDKVDDQYIDLENKEIMEADYIVAGSSFVKNSLLNVGVSASKVIVNPYGVNLNGLNYYPEKEHGKFTFLFLGAITARKGVPMLLSAWKKLNAKDAKLVLAGFGSLPANIDLPVNVEFLGAINPNKRDELFRAADAFVFPSLLEGMAQVLVEAAVCGLPIIATDNCGAEEIIDEGVNGFIIKPNDEEALINRMEYFLENPDKAAEMGGVSIDKIRDKFSMDSYGSRWTDILKNIK